MKRTRNPILSFRCMSNAVQADINKDFAKAIDLYYKEIESKYASIDSFLNLAFLLWQDTRHYTPKIDRVFSQAERLFPQSRLPFFWKIMFLQSDNRDILLCERDWVQILIPLTHASGIILTIPDDPDSLPLSFIDRARENAISCPTAKNVFLWDIIQSHLSKKSIL